LVRVSRFDEFEPTRAEREAFDCDNDALSDWLVRFAGQAMRSRDAVTYLLHEAREIVGFFTLSAGSVALGNATLPVGKRAPDPVPMLLLGRMGVHVAHQGKGLGVEIIRQAAQRALGSAETIGARGLLIHAIDDRARTFYEHIGLEQSPSSDRTFMISMAQLAATFAAVSRDLGQQSRHTLPHC
jgi:GNAT superfamily N-acetyltransferase